MGANVEIITIGTELLLGSTLDSNSAFLGRAMADIGLDIYAKHSVGDNPERLAQMLRRSLTDAEGVITTGGLGPTVDDLTKEAIGAVLDTPLELHKPSLAALHERFARLGREVSDNNRRQAYLPRGAHVLVNPHGTAPGFVARRADGRFIAALPGVPREMRPMVLEELVPWLRAHFSLEGGIITRTLRTVGIAESEIDRRIESFFRSQENPKIAVLAHNSCVDVKIMAKAKTAAQANDIIAPLETQLRQAIGPGIYGVDNDTLAGKVLERIGAQSARLALAESCTGGAITEALVAVPGASRVIAGGIVAYANSVKEELLGVPSEILAAHGAVSEATACAMAAGVAAALHAEYALSITGIAGPDGGTAEKPVGLVWMGLVRPGEKAVAREFRFVGDRTDIRSRAVIAALAWLFAMSGGSSE